MPEMIDQFRNQYYFLSNYSAYPACYDNIWYPTGEHAFAAAKTIDLADREKIRNAPTPGGAKRLGRSVTLRPHWDIYHRYESMQEIVFSKFRANESISGMLVATGDAILVEGNSWKDYTWGVDASTGKGHNLLGWMLMQVRDEMRFGAGR